MFIDQVMGTKGSSLIPFQFPNRQLNIMDCRGIWAYKFVFLTTQIFSQYYMNEMEQKSKVHTDILGDSISSSIVVSNSSRKRPRSMSFHRKKTCRPS